jgi:hypothetical protein
MAFAITKPTTLLATMATSAPKTPAPSTPAASTPPVPWTTKLATTTICSPTGMSARAACVPVLTVPVLPHRPNLRRFPPRAQLRATDHRRCHRHLRAPTHPSRHNPPQRSVSPILPRPARFPRAHRHSLLRSVRPTQTVATR